MDKKSHKNHEKKQCKCDKDCKNCKPLESLNIELLTSKLFENKFG